MKKLLLFFVSCLSVIGSLAQTSNAVVVNGYEAVDLALPSGTKWATCNVGAMKPEDYGNYFAWGETETKASYNEENSKWYGISTDSLIRQGVISANGNLTPKYDAATAYRGRAWHMPTSVQIAELIEKCIWKWTALNGVNGYCVVGPNGNSIFLPASGYCLGTSTYFAGYYGYSWSLSADTDAHHAYELCFFSDYFGSNDDFRYSGRAVRPVTE